MFFRVSSFKRRVHHNIPIASKYSNQESRTAKRCVSMSARVLASEASSWYLARLDLSCSNADNVKRCLRRPVLALTLKILVSETAAPDNLTGLEIETNSSVGIKGPDGTKPGDWRDHLRRSSSVEEDAAVWNEKDQEGYDSLARRAKARMDAFLDGCALAIPDDQLNSSKSRKKVKPRLPSKPQPASKAAKDSEISLSEGLSGYQVSQHSDVSGTSGGSSLSKEGALPLLRQISNSSSGSCVIYPQLREQELTTRLELYIRSLSRARTTKKECVIGMEPPRAIRARVNAIVAAFVNTVGCVSSVSPVLTQLLDALTRELLAVDNLGGELCKVAKSLVSEYEKQTSFASLAFLSSPEESAAKTLNPLLMSYVQYLQQNWELLVAECELERMLHTVLDKRMRHTFKTIEFQSIGHLLEVCQGFRKELQHIEIPPEMGGMQRDDIAKNCADPEAFRQAVRDLQRETITVNGHRLPPARSRRELVTLFLETLNSRTLSHDKRRRSKTKSKSMRRSESCPSSMSTRTFTDDDTDDLISSGNEGDTDGSSFNRRGEEVLSAGRRRTRRRSFGVKTVDMMTRRLLLAASRTGMGGDAFFVVRDLFGDDDVDVVPSKTPVAYGRPSRGGTIEIVVRLASVTIRCHGSFDVFPKPLGSFNEPLIQVHTTTEETVFLHEVRAGDEDEGDAVVRDGGSDDGSNDSSPKQALVIQERKTERTGWRTLSIRPALYEVVEVWNTPS